MEGEVSECRFTWFIENYSYYLPKDGQPLVSPEFIAVSLEGTAWSLELYPRGRKDEDSGYISFFLGRCQEDDGPEEITLKYILSFIRSNGTEYRSRAYEFAFKKGTQDGWSEFLERDRILSKFLADYLPEGTLGVRCRLKRGEGDVQSLAQIFARTRIEIEQISFLHVTERFSSVKPNQNNTVLIKSTKTPFALTSSVHYTDGSCPEEKIMVEITLGNADQTLSQCKLFVVDAYGKFNECASADTRLDDKRKDIQRLQLSLTRKEIMEKNKDYLPEDKLSLLCKCSFSIGVEHEIMGRAQVKNCVESVNQVIKHDQSKDIHFTTEKLFTSHRALVELKAVYDDQLLADVQLKTKTKSFPAHRIILSARSSVFKAMFTHDMKEKNTNCITVDDLENDTVEQLLFFMYSDSLEKLQWGSAMKLYYAADKYEVHNLKVICSSFLVDNLSASNAGELLVLADIHNDSDLKKAVEDFIYEHEKSVYGSEEWENLIETNAKLVSKTMLEIHKRKI